MRLCIALFIVFFAAGVLAAPSAPAGLAAEFVERGTRISWEYAGGEGISFNVYRGETVETAKVIANVNENFFIDKTASATRKYAYFVTALDSSGESRAAGSIVVEPTAPFSIMLVKPEKNTFDLNTAQKIDFVLAIDSNDISRLQDLKAVLVNDDFGTREDFAFDARKHLFSLSITPPEKSSAEAILTTYKVLITATVDGKPFSDSRDIVLTLIPKNNPNMAAAVQNILFDSPVGLAILLLAVFGTIVFVGWRWSLYKKADKDKLWLERLEVLRARAILNYDRLAGRRTDEQFREEEYVLQGKQNAVELKLGMAKKGSISVKPNPFDGCNQAEVIEIYGLAKMMQAKKKEMMQEEMRAWLVANGKSEKIAKKVAEVVYEK